MIEKELSPKILVIIPAYNEEKNIAKVIDELRKDLSIADILVINDCSKDGTLGVLVQNQVSYVSLPFNLGYSNALQTGFKYAAENNYDYLIQFDGDGQHIATEAYKLIDTIKQEDADIVIGSRFINQFDYKHSFFRKLGTVFFAFLIQMICKQKIYDPTSGFQILNKKVIFKYSKIFNFPEYPDANLIIEMLLRGYKIKEIPVQMRNREFGQSMHSGILRPVKYMIKMLYSICLIILDYHSIKKNKQ